MNAFTSASSLRGASNAQNPPPSRPTAPSSFLWIRNYCQQLQKGKEEGGDFLRLVHIFPCSGVERRLRRALLRFGLCLEILAAADRRCHLLALCWHCFSSGSYGGGRDRRRIRRRADKTLSERTARPYVGRARPAPHRAPGQYNQNHHSFATYNWSALRRRARLLVGRRSRYPQTYACAVP